MATFYENLKKYCDITGTDAIYTYETVVGSLPDDFKKRCEAGWTPSHTALTALAVHFGVSISDLTGKTTSKSLTYLAGPISGIPDYLEKHKTAKAYLESLGHAVISPAVATMNMPTPHMTRKMFLDHGLLLLSFCDTLALLPGWTKSSGCQLEYAYAKANAYQILQLNSEAYGRKPNEDGYSFLHSFL